MDWICRQVVVWEPSVEWVRIHLLLYILTRIDVNL